ncbi:hypothetical protein DMP08_00355 [Paraeggerthella hongkongensis]|uniref:Molecular chaperone TorD n=2 Tax=Paraeggerthella hongkongensis TaxID=230658 RepID=A0A3N0BKL1_9ACTN|nr:hypothetical protein DMP08_00355 [Paraeggerthella hongkongensis]
MQAELALARTLSLIAPLFTCLSEEEYAQVLQSGAGECARSVARSLARSCDEADSWERALSASFGWSDRAAFQYSVLSSGMPLAALPVESLYKPWSQEPGNGYGASRGLFLGDSARHMQVVYRSLEIDVPARFAAAPDHLSLLLDLLALYVKCENRVAARDLVADHFDWLESYDGTLSRRAEEAPLLFGSGAHVHADTLDAVLRGIARVRALLGVTQRLANEIAARSGQPALA